MRDSWDDLRVFLAVARGESLSAAGRILRMDAATVGRRVARLEQSVGAALFVKSPQGYALTEAGLRLVRPAESAEEALSEGSVAVRGATEGLSGQIRIGAPDGCANFLLPQVCAALTRDNPDLELQIVALPRVVNLSRREADLAVAVSAPGAGRLDVVEIAQYQLHLAATRDYLAAHPEIRRPKDLKFHTIVGYIPDMIFDRELDYLSDLGLDRVQLASNSVPVQMQWLKQGAGVGIVHDFALAGAPEMVRVLPQEVRLLRSFYLLRHGASRRRDRISRVAEALIDAMRAELTRLEGQVAAREA